MNENSETLHQNETLVPERKNKWETPQITLISNLVRGNTDSGPDAGDQAS